MNKRFAFVLIAFLSIFAVSCKTESRGGPAAAAVRPGFEKSFALTLTNPLPEALTKHPVVLAVPFIKASIPDFNPLNCGLWAGDSEAPLPFQADDLDGDGTPDEIVFLITLPPGPTVLAAHYSPSGVKAPDFPVRTYARLAWEKVDANIGWESNRGAYRFYWGQLEAFGKLDDSLIMAAFNAEYSYHDQQPWGMDTLHVGDASGLGGISVWDGQDRISTVNPAGKGPNQYRRTVVAAGPVRAVARVDIDGIGPAKATFGVRLIMSAFTDHDFSKQDIVVLSSAGGDVVYSPGIQKLAGETFAWDKDKGYLGTWGQGAPGAGEVGLGLMFNPSEAVGFEEGQLDRFVKLTAPLGVSRTFWILGGWHQGPDAPAAPQAHNWAKRLEDLSLKLRTDLAPRLEAR